MSKLTNFLIVAAVMVALVGCKKDEGSASSSSSYSTDRGNLKVTLNDWPVEGSKTPHVTVTGTGDGYTIGLYNIVPCMPEVLVPGCAENNGNYTGSVALFEGRRDVGLVATVDASGMVINVTDLHKGSFVGKKWIIAQADKADSLRFEDSDIYHNAIYTPFKHLKGKDTTAILPAINFSTNFNHDSMRVLDPYRKNRTTKPTAADSMDFDVYVNTRLQPMARAYVAGIGEMWYENAWWFLSQAEYLQFSEYGRCGVQLVDFYNCRAREYMSAVGPKNCYETKSSGYHETREYDGYYAYSIHTAPDAVQARIIHDSISGFNNPASGMRLFDLVNPYSQNCILTYGENTSYDTPVIEICSDWVGERLIQFTNFALKNIFYSTLHIDLEHLDIPFQVLKDDDTRLILGVDQNWLKGLTGKIWETVKDWDSTKFVTEVFPGWNNMMKLDDDDDDDEEKYPAGFSAKQFLEYKGYFQAINEYLQNGSKMEISIEFVPYDPENKQLMPWETFVINENKKAMNNK